MQESEITITSSLIRRKDKQTIIAKKKYNPELELNQNEIKTKIKTRISHFVYDKVRENSLIITSLGLLYFNFANVYCTDHNRRIE